VNNISSVLSYYRIPVGVMPLSGALPTIYPDPDPDRRLNCQS